MEKIFNLILCPKPLFNNIKKEVGINSTYQKSSPNFREKKRKETENIFSEHNLFQSLRNLLDFCYVATSIQIWMTYGFLHFF